MEINYELRPGRTLEKAKMFFSHKPEISIITAYYNAGRDIIPLANSILNQTYPYYEWIIIDDGSTNEDDLKALEKIKTLDKRIKVFHKENNGPGPARDYGVEKSDPNTNYLCFIDADDLMDKTFLECAYFAMNCKENASWCYSDTINFQDQTFTWQKQFSSRQMKQENCLTLHSLMKKKDFLEVGGFSLSGNAQFEDWNLYLKLLAQKKYPIHMSYFGFWYRKVNGSGVFNRAKTTNQKNAYEEIEKTSKHVPDGIFAIEYPRATYHYSGINMRKETIVLPKQKKDGKKHILFIAPWMTIGGADKFNLDLFRLLDKEKYAITLVTTQPTEYIWRQRYEQYCEEIFDLSSFLDQEDWPSFLGYLIESRRIDLLLNSNSTAGYAMLPYLKANYQDLKIMDYIHMEEWYNRNGGYSRDSSAVTSVIDRTLFCNQKSASIMVEHFKVPKEKVGTVYIGVDPQEFNPKKFDAVALKEKYQIPSNKLIVTFLARIDYQKRPFLLLEIIKHYTAINPDVLFLIAGDGPLLKEIKRKATHAQLNNYIRFLGKTDHADELYAISDITLNCSIKEGLALTSYESLAMGVPVISSDVGGQKELIDETVGVIVPCLQKEADVHNTTYSFEEIKLYVQALQTIVGSLDIYQKACRKRILSGFTLENMATKMDEEITFLLKQKETSENGLAKHIDVTKELINDFFEAEANLYDWYCRSYRLKIYGRDKTTEELENSRLERVNAQLDKMAYKAHITEEMPLVKQYGFAILRQIKRLLVAVVKIPVLCILFVVRFLILESKRLIRIIKRKVGK